MEWADLSMHFWGRWAMGGGHIRVMQMRLTMTLLDDRLGCVVGLVTVRAIVGAKGG